ncbi:hypothetical protein LXA43DRAFT_1062128 [Ganoderma leucocontextum]|nr:hypothetical protein LXA43DRAFT_1062128 [Ganoderma leucocontextum]
MYVLQHRNNNYDTIQWKGGASTVPPHAPSKPIIAPAPVCTMELSVPIKKEEMALSMAMLISKEVAAVIASSLPAFGGQRHDPAPYSTTPCWDCFYLEDISKKKIKRENGLLIMFDGSLSPYNICRWMLQEIVNIYCDTRHDTAPAAEQMMLKLMTPDSDYIFIKYGTG